MLPRVVSIAVVGVTGAGKTSFIRNVTGRDDIVITSGLKSQTATIQSYFFDHDGVTYELIDTPGFDDTERTDEEILQCLIKYLGDKYAKSYLLSGVLYLHPIHWTRVQGSTMAQIRVLEQLCGDTYMKNIVIGTTFWEETDHTLAEKREEELFSTSAFLGDMKDLGAKTTRVYQDQKSCLDILNMFTQNLGETLKVQEQLKSSHGDIETTDAMKALLKEIAVLRAEQEQAKFQAKEKARKEILENEERLDREEAEKVRIWEEEQRLKEAERQEREKRLKEEEILREQQRQDKLKREKEAREAQEEKSRQLEAEAMRALRAAREKEERLSKEREAAESKHKAWQEELAALKSRQNAYLEANRKSRNHLKLRRLGSIDKAIFGLQKCDQPVHTSKTRVEEFWECSWCERVACRECYDSDRKIVHSSFCFFK